MVSKQEILSCSTHTRLCALLGSSKYLSSNTRSCYDASFHRKPVKPLHELSFNTLLEPNRLYIIFLNRNFNLNISIQIHSASEVYEVIFTSLASFSLIMTSFMSVPACRRSIMSCKKRPMRANAYYFSFEATKWCLNVHEATNWIVYPKMKVGWKEFVSSLEQFLTFKRGCCNNINKNAEWCPG